MFWELKFHWRCTNIICNQRRQIIADNTAHDKPQRPYNLKACLTTLLIQLRTANGYLLDHTRRTTHPPHLQSIILTNWPPTSFRYSLAYSWVLCALAPSSAILNKLSVMVIFARLSLGVSAGRLSSTTGHHFYKFIPLFRPLKAGNWRELKTDIYRPCRQTSCSLF